MEPSSIAAFSDVFENQHKQVTLDTNFPSRENTEYTALLLGLASQGDFLPALTELSKIPSTEIPRFPLTRQLMDGVIDALLAAGDLDNQARKEWCLLHKYQGPVPERGQIIIAQAERDKLKEIVTRQLDNRKLDIKELSFHVTTIYYFILVDHLTAYAIGHPEEAIRGIIGDEKTLRFLSSLSGAPQDADVTTLSHWAAKFLTDKDWSDFFCRLSFPPDLQEDSLADNLRQMLYSLANEAALVKDLA